MSFERTIAAVPLLLLLTTTGCVGGVRNTTTPRTSTEMLLVSTAAERAIQQYDVEGLSGKRVFIDSSKFDSVDKKYVISALREHLAKANVILASKAAPATKEEPSGADVLLQIRNATLGIWDGDFVLGIPALKIGAEGFGDTTYTLPPLYAFRRLSAQGFAKLQLWLLDPTTRTFLGRSGDLWGHSFYNQWWVLGVGPFDGSNDIYPDFDWGQYVPGSDEDDEDEEG